MIMLPDVRLWGCIELSYSGTTRDAAISGRDCDGIEGSNTAAPRFVSKTNEDRRSMRLNGETEANFYGKSTSLVRLRIVTRVR